MIATLQRFTSARHLVLAVAMTAALMPMGVRSAAAAATIQPGAYVGTSVGGCTLSFVLRDGGSNVYILTAGHCTKTVGERVKDENGVAFATVVARSNSGPSDDITLLRVDADKHGRVSPAVRSWGGPTGYTRASDTALGDRLYLYGYGAGFGLAEATRPRQGVLVSDNATTYAADTLAVNGDSGGPILHARTGKALGLVSQIGFSSATTDQGPTVEQVLAWASARGYGLTLQTAALN